MEILQEIEARKVAISADEAWGRLKSAAKVVVGKGQKVVTYIPDTAAKEALLADVMGRSGNLRAPTLQVNGVYYVGFNEKMYGELMA